MATEENQSGCHKGDLDGDLLGDDDPQHLLEVLVTPLNDHQPPVDPLLPRLVEPSPQGVLLTVWRSFFLGRGTGPFTLRFRAWAIWRSWERTWFTFSTSLDSKRILILAMVPR